jgi:hypothetical protein
MSGNWHGQQQIYQEIRLLLSVLPCLICPAAIAAPQAGLLQQHSSCCCWLLVTAAAAGAAAAAEVSPA